MKFLTLFLGLAQSVRFFSSARNANRGRDEHGGYQSDNYPGRNLSDLPLAEVSRRIGQGPGESGADVITGRGAQS